MTNYRVTVIVQALDVRETFPIEAETEGKARTHAIATYLRGMTRHPDFSGSFVEYEVEEISRVQTVLDALKADGWANVEFANTGGGCHAIRLSLGNPSAGDWREILITGEDVFHASDLTSDANLGDLGQWFVGYYDGSGDLENEALIEEKGRPFAEVVAEIVAATNRLAGVSAFRQTTSALGADVNPDGLAVLHEEGDGGRVVLIDEVEVGVMRVGLYPHNGTDTPTAMVEIDDVDVAVALVRGWGF